MQSDSDLIFLTYPWHVCPSGRVEPLDPISACKLEKNSLGVCVFAVCCKWWHVHRESSNTTSTGPRPTHCWLLTAWCQPEFPSIHLKKLQIMKHIIHCAKEQLQNEKHLVWVGKCIHRVKHFDFIKSIYSHPIFYWLGWHFPVAQHSHQNSHCSAIAWSTPIPTPIPWDDQHQTPLLLDNLLIWDNFSGCDQIKKKKKSFQSCSG